MTQWKPAIVVPEEKKRDRRVARYLRRLGLCWNCIMMTKGGYRVD